MARLLDVRNLKTRFFTQNGVVHAVNDVSFHVNAQETVGIVGESGSGKSITMLSAMRLIPSPPGKIVGGEVMFQGQDLLKLSGREMRSLRGNRLSMIFQDPMTSLNPVLRVEKQMTEAIQLHLGMAKSQAKARAVELLEQVGIPGARDRIRNYPHQFSGGMRQRASLCRALIHQPEILLLDEPFGALDAFTREEMWVMLQNLWMRVKCVGILITHDLREAVFLSDTVYVMSPRPSSIIYQLKIDLPRPRTLEMCLTDDFNHLFSHIRRHIRRS